MCISLALLITGCASTVTRLQVTGPYAQTLSADDIEQIKQIVQRVKDVHYQAISIEVTRRDHAVIDATHSFGNTSTDTTIEASRDRGHWHRVKRSPNPNPNDRIIVFYDATQI
jgi:hypothetical protein